MRELAVCAVLLMACSPLGSLAQQPGQKTFASAEEASNALVTAVENNDEKATLELLGADGKEIVSSGDETEDAHSRAEFVQAYREMHRLAREPDGTTTLYIGAKNWPTPIPLVHKGHSWYFDTDAGKMEILFRRIGRNEISAIRICRELAAAEEDFHHTQPQYAERILSNAGTHNGLYWPAAAGDTQSPIGPLVASAVTEGYADNGREIVKTPYRGYYFHVMKGQGAHASGGEKSYIVNGKMTEGFAFVAYPAQYRSSGVMTFIVGSDGSVFQKDLGKDTAVAAKAMKQFDPDATWHRADEAQAEALRDRETR